MSVRRQDTQLLKKQSSNLKHKQANNNKDELQRRLPQRNKSPTPRHIHTSKSTIMEIRVSYS